MKKILTTLILLCFNQAITLANNLKIENVTVAGNNISFDVSWENSWNSVNNVDTLYPRNWDAAWIFVKVQSDADNLWKHQNLSVTGSNHSITGGILQVDAVSDGVGVFIRRTGAGSGNISGTATLSMQTLPAGLLNFKVFGVEMVNIPQGSFYLNDGATGNGRFNNYTVTSSTIPASALFSGQPALSASYPTGYQAIYCAKYETSNASVIDFLNTLTYDQQLNITNGANPNGISGSVAFSTGQAIVNNIIIIDTPGISATKPAVYAANYNNNNIYNEANDGLNLSCVSFSVRMAIAYLDWCGLRPMTDMEYEKICRGTQYTGTPNPRVSGEYPWGTTNINGYSNNISYWATDSARFVGAILNGRALVSGVVVTSGARNGLFANNSTGREAAGAAFYGPMEMCGNARDIAFFTNTSSNNITMNSLGDGNLISTLGPTNGDGNVAEWSNYSANTYWGTKGYGTFGNNAASINSWPVSSRTDFPIATTVLSAPSYVEGVRGVR